MSDSDTLANLHEASGKVREMYGFGNEILMVASDRMSAFDVVLPTAIPHKGRVLTALSLFWFDRTKPIVPNHLISAEPGQFPAVAQAEPDLAGRAMLVRRLTMMPIECVVRGYLVGSGWKDYQATGSVCGHVLPPGMKEAEKLPTPIFTPATKATDGHDINIDRSAGALLVGEDRYDELERISIEVYESAAEYALTRGIIIADTKFEFGLDGLTNELVLGDEVLTPDSSRFWPADSYQVGMSPPSFDKQYLRNWLETLVWNKEAPGPEIPAEVVAETQARYVEAYETLTGGSFDAYLKSMGVTP
jgi:phosphoribosylaminoimidazole-succinocarboxamide synthase